MLPCDLATFWRAWRAPPLTSIGWPQHTGVMAKARAYAPQRDQAEAKTCDSPGCASNGEFRAPRGRHARDGHYWFCLDHVRAYNATWDFFSGMNQAEIEDYQQNNSTWHRPTWRFSGRIDGQSQEGPHFVDPFDIMPDPGSVQFGSGASKPKISPEQRKALNDLGLAGVVTLAEIKTRYKKLVKRYHPDTNGGDKKAEERLKKINRAYTYLLSCGYT